MTRRAGRHTVDLGREDPTCTTRRHGTPAAYRAGCRCPQAREAWRLYGKRLRQGRPEIRRVDATGTIRRIRALMALGHTATTIGEAAGRSSTAVTTVANRRRRWVEPGTDAAYRRAYASLSMTPGTSAKTRSRALAWGWAPPLAWDDDAIDDPEAEPQNPKPREHGIDHAAITLVVSGLANVPLSKPERQLAGQRMVAGGVDAAIIVERLGVTAKTVAYHRAHQQQRVAA